MPHRRFHSLLPWLVSLGLAAGVALGGWAYWTYYYRPDAGAGAERAILGPENFTGFLTTEKLALTVTVPNPDGGPLHGNLRLELTDPRGKLLADRDKLVKQTERSASYRLELPTVNVPASKVTLSCTFRHQKFAVPLSRVLTIQGHETSLNVDKEFRTASPAALRCGVHRVKSLWETIPVGAAQVVVNLRSADGAVFLLHEGKTDEHGWDHARFQVPAIPPGPYTLQVVTRSEIADETLERPVEVKPGARLLLFTDRAAYQPGQTLHARAFAFRPVDLKPLSGVALGIEIEDVEGKTVFRQSQPSSEHGEVAADWQLAADVAPGSYRVRVISGDLQAEKIVTVERPAPTGLAVNVTSDKPFYAPRETPHVEVKAADAGGKPAAGVALDVTAALVDGSVRPLPGWKGKTDAEGRAKFDVNLAGSPPRDDGAHVRLVVTATDRAGNTQTVRRSYPIADQPLRVHLLPEGGRLVPDLENRVAATAFYPDGTPALCNLLIRLGKALDKRGPVLVGTETREGGVAQFRFTPQGRFFRGPPRVNRAGEAELQPAAEAVESRRFELTVEARDRSNRSVTRTVELPARSAPEHLLLGLDRAVYPAGEPIRIEVRASAGIPDVNVDVVRAGQRVAVRRLRLDSGKADDQVELPPGAFGPVEVHVAHRFLTGETIHDCRVAYVQPRTDWRLALGPDQSVPAADALGQVRTSSAGKDGASPGLLRVDDVAYPLPETAAGATEVCPLLVKELIRGQPANGSALAAPLPDPEAGARRQRMAGALFAPLCPSAPEGWIVEPAAERRQLYFGRVRQVGQALYRYAQAGKTFMSYDRVSKRWSFRPGLLPALVEDHFLDPDALTGPFGDPLGVQDLSKMEDNTSVERLAEMVTWTRMQRLMEAVARYTDAHRADFFRDGKWNLPAGVPAEAVGRAGVDPLVLKDAWGEAIRLAPRAVRVDHQTGWTQFDHHDLISAGPDRRFGTPDDLKLSSVAFRHRVAEPWFGLGGTPKVSRGERKGKGG